MTGRRKKKSISRQLFIIGILLLSASLAQAGPLTLGDAVLDQITAGTSDTSGSGGAIIGNSSDATINQTGGVELSGEVQSGARGLNLVNTAESTVANGVNVWDGGDVTSGRFSPEMEVNQVNNIYQEQRRSASMPSYSRPEADTLSLVEKSGAENHNDKVVKDNTVVDLSSKKRVAYNESSAKVDTTIAGKAGDDLQIDTNTGKGLAVAGQLDAKLDAGEFQVGLAVAGPVVAHPDTNTASGYGGMDVGNEDSDFTLYGRLILPELEIEINGAGCGVAMGSCESNGTSTEDTLDVNDNSLIDTKETTSVGASQFNESSSEIYRSPFELDNAQAEYIVVDDSSLEVNTTFNLALSGSAQKDMRGMNVVNATGSAVADGVNVARTTQMSSGNLSLKQSNMISHSR